MKVLITNSVPLNGGDEALLRATIGGMKLVFSDIEVQVLCTNVPLCRKHLPDLKLDADFEYNLSNESLGFWEKLKARIRIRLQMHLKIKPYSFLSLLFAHPKERKAVGFYKKADLILSSAGGYIHDFYPIENRLKGFELAIELKKNLVIFAQSVGPFWKDQSKERVKNVFDRIPIILLREHLSEKHLKNIGVSLSNIFVTADAAFIYRKLNPELFVTKIGKVESIAMCFRKWPIQDIESENIISKAVELCIHILRDQQRSITFISTCQGIDGYTDDSLLAKKIIARLPLDIRTKCFIDSKRYSPTNLIKQYSKFDAYVGMRLHGSILAMLGGTPAMGIAYEDKTKGVYSQLGLEKFHVNYDDEIALWKRTFDIFVENISNINSKLPAALDNIANLAEKNIELIKTRLK